jgi:hypothetical protein
MLFAAIGAGTLYWCKMEARKDAADSARFESKHSGQTQEFIRRVNEQVAKGDKVRLDFSWLKDEKSPAQRQQEQHERLLGDIDRLAAGAEPLYPEVLYGDNWRDEVEEYKTNVYRRDMIQVGSVGVLIAGALLMCLGLFLVVIAAIRNIWRQGNVEGNQPQDNTDQIKAEMKTALADLAGDIEARQKRLLTDLTGTAVPGAPASAEAVTAKFDESLNKFGKGLQNRLEGLISRIESAYNAGSKRNDEMLNHISALLKDQGVSLEKITAEIETVAGSFMHEFAKQGQGMDERFSRIFREHSEQLAQETETLKKLVRDIDSSLAVSGATSGSSEGLESALAELRRGIVSDLGAVPNGGSSELKELIEKVEAVMAVGPSDDVRSELQRTLAEFREGITLDLASLTCKDTDALKQLIEKLEASSQPSSGSLEGITEALGELRSAISTDITSAAAAQADAVRELKSALDESAGKTATTPTVDITAQVEKALGQFKDSITLDLADLTSKDMNSIKELIASLESSIGKAKTGGKQHDTERIVAEIRQAVAEESTAQAKAIAALSKALESLSQQQPADFQAQMQESLGDLKSHLDKHLDAIAGTLSQVEVPAGDSGKYEELLSAVKNSDAAIAQASDRILARVEELSAASAQQLASMLPAVDLGSAGNASGNATVSNDIMAATLSKAEAIEKSVEEASRQIWAIREYASRQQERMERLQDGYDWNIIGNFCLRVIRCVDNLDDRMAELTIAGLDTRHLQVLRDELLFAMESSGVERFEVEPGSDFRGQESRLKAQGQREVTDNPDLIGKVAMVIRPGYQCYISEDTTKTVRPAEVRVYGQTSVEEIALGGSSK